MDLVELKKQITTDTLQNFYIFSGDEIALQNIYINQMGEDIRRVDTVGEIYTSLTSRLIGGNTNNRVVYVVRDDKDFMSRDKVFTDISKKIKNGILILCITELNKNTKFYHMYKDEIIEFPHLSTPQLFPMISKMVNGRDSVINYLIERCNNDYATITNNIDKFNNMQQRELTKDIVDNLVPYVEDVDIYEFIDDVIKLDSISALRKLSILLNNDANELGILSLLYKKINHCVLVEGYRGSESIAKDTGLNGYECRSILDNNKIPPANLLYCLRLIHKYDKGIKMGKYEPTHAVWCCVVEILSL